MDRERYQNLDDSSKRFIRDYNSQIRSGQTSPSTPIPSGVRVLSYKSRHVEQMVHQPVTPPTTEQDAPVSTSKKRITFDLDPDDTAPDS